MSSCFFKRKLFKGIFFSLTQCWQGFFLVFILRKTKWLCSAWNLMNITSIKEKWQSGDDRRFASIWWRKGKWKKKSCINFLRKRKLLDFILKSWTYPAYQVNIYTKIYTANNLNVHILLLCAHIKYISEQNAPVKG